MMAAKGMRFTRPASDDEFDKPLAYLDGLGCLGHSIVGKRVLCLAAGGGRHGPLYASAGAHVTVVDLSAEMLQLDRRVAEQRRLELRTVQASMDELSVFAVGEFDIVIQPVSTCYVPDVLSVYRQVARVTAPNGIYISQHKTPTSLQSDIEPTGNSYVISRRYYDKQPLANVAGSRLREEGTMEFVHRWEEFIGGLCRAGFVVEDLVEPRHDDDRANIGSFGHRAAYIAPYVRIKARRIASAASGPSASPFLWQP
ncbi:MAG: class I SAM-dependent methyltransferase [Planctomycetales bacterium]|nr:class I SAM-dependent methyltransferase [Planctomycetales bacterium]